MFKSIRHSLWSFGVVSTCAVAASVSAAAPAGSDPEAAKALFEDGKALLNAGDWPGACRKFDESLARQLNASTLVKVARCRVREGKLATASQAYEQARQLNQQEQRSTQANLAATIDREMAEIAPRIPRLRIVVADAPAGLTIRSNGSPVPPAAVGGAFLVDPGEYQIAVEAPGFVSETKSATVGERTSPDQVVEVSFRLVAAPAASVVPPPEAGSAGPPPEALPVSQPAAPTRHQAAVSSDKPSEQRGGPSTRRAGYVVGGAGVVGLAAAGVLGVLTLRRVGESDDYCNFPGETCNQRGMELRDEARDLQTAGLIVAGLGTAALLTGVTLVVTAKDTAPTTTVSLGPTAISGGLRW